jgi:hypothetical protein
MWKRTSPPLWRSPEMVADAQLSAPSGSAPGGGSVDSGRPTEPEVTPQSPTPPAAPDWPTYYAGLEGLDARVGPQKAAALKMLDSDPDPEEARARAINQSYVASAMPSMTAAFIRSNWPAVKDMFSASTLGIPTKGMSDKSLYAKIGQNFQRLDELKQEDGSFENLKNTLFRPFVAIPGIPAQQNRALQVAAGTANAFRPFVEGFETPAGLLTLGAGSELTALSRTYPAAKAALVGMGGLFTALMARQTGKAAAERIDVLSNPNHTLQDATQANVNVVASGLATLLGAFGTLEGVKPEVLSKLKGQSPPDALSTLQAESVAAKKPEEKAAIMQAAEALNEVSRVDIGPRNVEISTGDGVEADHEAAMIANWKDQIKKETAPPPAPKEPVGIKNAVVDEALEKMGLPKAEHGEKLSFTAALADAQEKLASDPFAGQKLVDSLVEKPRPVTGKEIGLLLTEVNRRRLERDAAETDLIEAHQRGDADAVAEANVRIAKARDDFQDAEEASTRIGTDQAQGLALRQMMIAEDYSLASMERQLAAASKDGKLTPEQVEAVRRIQKSFVKTKAELDAHIAARLKAAKRRLEIQAEEVGAKLQRGDLRPNPKPEPVDLDEEGMRLQAEHERVKQEFQTEVIKARLAARSPLDVLQDTLVKWRRGFLLSGPVTLAKLTSAAAQRMVFTPAEEGLGGFLGKLPFVSRIAEKAPREGGFNSNAEARAITKAFTQGIRDAGELLKSGKGVLEVLYGKGKDAAVRESDVAPHSVIEFFGQIHGALKAPVKRAEFERSMEKRLAFGIKNGVDVSNPLVQANIAVEAYKDANRAIFLQDNMVTDAYKRALSAFEENNKATGKPNPGGKLIGTAARVSLPIVKVPTNIVGETVQYATGLATGSVRLANAFRNGIDSLSPEQADLIMRELKKGSIGAAVLLMGYFNPKVVGGYYQPGEKRRAKDVPVGEIKVYGTNIPAFLLHNPLLEVAQLGATVRRVADAKLKGQSQGTGTGLWAGLMGLLDKVPFAHEAVTSGKIIGGGPEGRYEAGELVKSIVDPAALQSVAEFGDKDRRGRPVKRNPQTVLQHIETGIPVLREKVKKRDTKVYQ